MEDKVTALANSVVAAQGIRIIEWFKAFVDREGVTSDNFAYISEIIPVTPLTEQLQVWKSRCCHLVNSHNYGDHNSQLLKL